MKKEINVASVPILFKEFGSARQPALLIIHGFPGNAQDWEDAAARLASTFRVVLPDLNGFGNRAASNIKFEDVSMHSQARDIVRLIHHLQLNELTIIGHDFGVPIAVCVEKILRGRVKKLILSAGNLSTHPPLNPLMRSLNRPLVGRWAEAFLFSSFSINMMRRVGTKKGPRYPTKNSAAEREAIRTIFATSLRDVKKHFGEVEQASRSVEACTLLVWGDSDPFFNIEFARQLSDQILGSKLKVYGGVGHYVHLEETARFVNDITEFVLR